MNVAWDHERNIRILQEKVSCINFTCYKDESNEIRRSSDAIEADETESDSNNDNDNDVVLLNKTNEYSYIYFVVPNTSLFSIFFGDFNVNYAAFL